MILWKGKFWLQRQILAEFWPKFAFSQNPFKKAKICLFTESSSTQPTAWDLFTFILWMGKRQAVLLLALSCYCFFLLWSWYPGLVMTPFFIFVSSPHPYFWFDWFCFDFEKSATQLFVSSGIRDEAATSYSLFINRNTVKITNPLSTILTVNPTALIITLRLSALSLNSCARSICPIYPDHPDQPEHPDHLPISFSKYRGEYSCKES